MWLRGVSPPSILCNLLFFKVNSPSNTALSSLEQVKAYLLSEGTCKCGLECPFNCDATFNFNSKVLTRPWTAPVIGPGDTTKLCNHKRKLLTHASIENIDNRYDALRKKKRKIITPPSVSQLLIQRDRGEQLVKDQQTFNGLPWRENLNHQFGRSSTYSNGYQQDDTSLRFHLPELQRMQATVHRFPAQVAALQGVPSTPASQPISPMTPQVHFENRPPYPVQGYDVKYNKKVEYPTPENVRVAAPSNVSGNRSTPPWQQNKLQVYERVPPLHQPPAPVWTADIKKKQQPPKILQRKRFSDENPNLDTGIIPDQPSFMDDPSGYLAQQTALLNSTISRQNASCTPADSNKSGNGGIPLASNVNRYIARPKSRNTPTPAPSRFPDSCFERIKGEEPSSTDSDKGIDERGPIQGTTVSTSNRSPGEASPDTVTTVVTTMASGHTASSNTITSVLAGRANTATVTVNNQSAGKQELQINIQPELIKPAGGHILVSSNGQLIVANSMLSPQQQSIHKNVTSQGSAAASSGQIGVTSQVLNQPTVLVNTLPGPLLLQPSVVVDGTLNTVQLPQIVGVQNQIIEENQVLSPDSKRKTVYKKRKLSPTVSSMLLSPQSTNNVVVQPQQINPPMVQALTILPSKTNFAGTQQLITTNMLQPLNLVQNFPIQQFIVPAGVSGMVMSDGTILQDAVQLNLLTPVQNTGVFNGQNILAPGMVIRAPATSQSSKVIQNNQFLSSPNHYLVNNTFNGQLSPMLSVSPNRNQEFIPQNVVVQQQPSTSNTTVVQQNTTIVQQTTMVSNQQTQPTPTLNLNQNFILNDKPNFILTSEKQNFILSPNSDKILISPDNVRGNFVVSNIDKQNFVINNVEKQNVVVNSFDKSFLMDKKNTVSTQTQSQLVAAARGGNSGSSLMVGTSSEHSTAVYAEIAADTTTLSPVDHEVTTSLQTPPTSSPTSDPTAAALPMVHCVSSSSHLDDAISIDNYNGNMNKPTTYSESSSIAPQAGQGKNDDYASKSLCNVPDSVHITNGGSEVHVKEEDFN
ncbi:six-banded isoform X2 [Rhodnius prolixus]|uniref:six-banded isoform X2 n=1 Tax=Rhodnius prolixus TaxID=13249 RepID=UPI003D18D1CF